MECVEPHRKGQLSYTEKRHREIKIIWSFNNLRNGKSQVNLARRFSEELETGNKR